MLAGEKLKDVENDTYEIAEKKYDIDLCPMFVFDEKVKLDGAILQSKFEEALLGKLEPNV